MSGSNVIELNGKKYDTRTGQLIREHKAPSGTHQTHHARAQSQSAQPKKPASTASSVSRKPARNIDGIKRAPQKTTGHARSANHTTRKAQRSQTLVRHGVAQPHASSAVAIQTPAPVAIVAPSSPLLGIDKARLKRAQLVHQDKRINRFAVLEPRVVETEPQTRSTATPVQAQPVAVPVEQAAVQPGPSHLERAVANATSHNEKKVALKSLRTHHKIAKKLHVKPRTITTATLVLAFLMLGGIITYRQMPQIQTKIASSRAGVSGSLPSYTPAGFSMLRGVDYQPGQITITYASKANDGRSYTVTQTDSVWTSDSLRENYLDSLGTEYQTVRENGKTIYIYDGNATWVDGGVWYRVQASDAHLSSQQLSDIISSL